MFGADTPLVLDALQIAALALVVGGLGMFALLRKRKSAPDSDAVNQYLPGNLEDRVRVLERIATDQSIGLADEIEALREPSLTKGKAE